MLFKCLNFAALVTLLLTLPIHKVSAQTPKKVFISGCIQNLNNQFEVEDMSAIGRISLPNPEHFAIPDSIGNFLMEMEIGKPGYFRIGRNLLFLSPGDSVYALLDYKYQENAVFRGSNAHLNEYLKGTPFPMAGSYSSIDGIIKPTVEETVGCILAFAGLREKLLLSIKDVPNEFLLLENARIRADIINSILDLYYEFPDFNKLAENERQEFEKKFLLQKDSLILPFAKFFLDSNFLNLVVYQRVAYALLKPNNDQQENVHYKNIQDWLVAQKLFGDLRLHRDKSNGESTLIEIENLTSDIYRNTLLEVFKRIMAFGNGNEAINIIAKDRNGQQISLLSLKGKIIILDFWATWCGPCVAAFPKINTLREKYVTDTSIIILSVSIDNDHEKWKRAVSNYSLAEPNWIVDRFAISNYQVDVIPRTIIIDKNFRIAAFKGPGPENLSALSGIINELKQKSEPQFSK